MNSDVQRFYEEMATKSDCKNALVMARELTKPPGQYSISVGSMHAVCQALAAMWIIAAKSRMTAQKRLVSTLETELIVKETQCSMCKDHMTLKGFLEDQQESIKLSSVEKEHLAAKIQRLGRIITRKHAAYSKAKAKLEALQMLLVSTEKQLYSSDYFASFAEATNKKLAAFQASIEKLENRLVAQQQQGNQAEVFLLSQKLARQRKLRHQFTESSLLSREDILSQKRAAIQGTQTLLSRTEKDVEAKTEILVAVRGKLDELSTIAAEREKVAKTFHGPSGVKLFEKLKDTKLRLLRTEVDALQKKHRDAKLYHFELDRQYYATMEREKRLLRIFKPIYCSIARSSTDIYSAFRFFYIRSLPKKLPISTIDLILSFLDL
jgi:hypothetical protein